MALNWATQVCAFLRIHQMIRSRFAYFVVSFASRKEKALKKYETLVNGKHTEIFRASVLMFMIYFEMHQKM